MDTSNIDEDINLMLKELGTKIRGKKKDTAVKDICIQSRDDYIDLLKRVCEKMTIIAESPIVHISPPNIIRSGSKIVTWTNFIGNCETIRRDHTQVMNYVLNELLVDGNLDCKQNFIIRGLFTPKQITSIFTKYIRTYVKCDMCGKIDTYTEKINGKYMSVMCNNCKASKNVEVVKKINKKIK